MNTKHFDPKAKNEQQPQFPELTPHELLMLEQFENEFTEYHERLEHEIEVYFAYNYADA